MLVVLACPRSGTAYATQVFRAVGRDVRHEDKNGADGIVSWWLACQPEDIPPPSDVPRKRWRVVLHQVRHPLDVIRSLHTISPKSWTCMRNAAGVYEGVKLAQAAHLWLNWNRRCERLAAYTYPVEMISDHWEAICKTVPIERQPCPVIPTDINTRRHREQPEVTWEKLFHSDPEIAAEVKALAERYGYRE